MVHFLMRKAVMLFESDRKSGQDTRVMAHLLVSVTCRYTSFLE